MRKCAKIQSRLIVVHHWPRNRWRKGPNIGTQVGEQFRILFPKHFHEGQCPQGEAPRPCNFSREEFGPESLHLLIPYVLTLFKEPGCPILIDWRTIFV